MPLFLDNSFEGALGFWKFKTNLPCKRQTGRKAGTQIHGFASGVDSRAALGIKETRFFWAFFPYVRFEVPHHIGFSRLSQYPSSRLFFGRALLTNCGTVGRHRSGLRAASGFSPVSPLREEIKDAICGLSPLIGQAGHRTQRTFLRRPSGPSARRSAQNGSAAALSLPHRGVAY